MIRMNDVFKEYSDGTKALKGVTFSLDAGEFAFLVGPSGSGKSTIVRLLIGEIAPSDGEVIVNGQDMDNIKMRKMPYLRRTIGCIFQDYENKLIEYKSVYENVAFAMHVIGASTKDIRQRVPYVLELVGLEYKAKSKPNELSGGEQQRVAVARALVNNPRLIIADEPTGNLDPARSLEMLLLLKKINELGTTVLVVTHEKPLVDQFSQRVIAIDGGRIVSDALDRYYNYESE